MIDGGFRRGNDVLLALALGADFVFLGRPFDYAGAVAGEAGIRHAISILASEVLRNMALIGVVRLDELGMDRIVLRNDV
jgi:L-lactate dehydrogenase (cytochrome)